MSLIDDLNRLDKLILDHAKESEAAKLRNKTSLIREHVEALIEDKNGLRNKLRVLENTSKQRIAELERLVLKLEEEAKQNKKPDKGASSDTGDLPHYSKAFLMLLADGDLTVAELASRFNHSPGNVEHYLQILRGRKFASRVPGVIGGPRPRSASYRILPSGSEWLEDHGLSPESP